LHKKIAGASNELNSLPEVVQRIETRSTAISEEALSSVAQRLKEIEGSMEETRRAAASFNEAVRQILEFVRAELSRQ
jgi:archaellum component FlaC